MTDKKLHYSTLEQESLICARCGYCRNVCPIYQTVGWESGTPRGKISLARQIFNNGQDEHLSEEFAQRLAQCTLCGACGHACATEIDTRTLWLEMRKRLVDLGKEQEGSSLLRKNILDNKNITTFDNEERLDWAEDLDEPEPLDARHGADVCYFVGCVSSFYPQAAEIAVAFAEILTEAEVDFTTMGGAEWCCGFPLLGGGHVDDATRFIRHNVEKIKEMEIHTIVASCPSCYHVWQHQATEFIGDYPLAVFHATEYLTHLIKEEKLQLAPFDELITYHDPCDLGRNSTIFDAPRFIIESIPQAKLVELEHNRMDALCCGGGGNLQSSDPGLSEEIALLRIAEVEASGASVLVSACQQCTKVLGMAARKAKIAVKVMDINQLVRRVISER